MPEENTTAIVQRCLDELTGDADPLHADELATCRLRADAMCRLRAIRAPLRLQFLETALHDPETARRVGRRADWIVQAIVGCDRA